MPIIAMQPERQLGASLLGGVEGGGIGPFAQRCLDEALGLAIGLRGIGLGADVGGLYKTGILKRKEPPCE
jgi:hypothetical protein